MANISQIQVGDTTYDICDATVRSGLLTVEQHSNIPAASNSNFYTLSEANVWTGIKTVDPGYPGGFVILNSHWLFSNLGGSNTAAQYYGGAFASYSTNINEFDNGAKTLAHSRFYTCATANYGGYDLTIIWITSTNDTFWAYSTHAGSKVIVTYTYHQFLWNGNPIALSSH